MNFEIVPTVFTSDFNEFTRKLNLARGIVPRVQIDFVDGKFAENRTVDFEAVEHLFTEVEETLKIRTDVHLMVKEPSDWISRAMKIIPDRIIGQVEMMGNPLDFVNQVIDSGIEVGIALDLETPVSVVSEEIYHLCDVILIMGVKAGLEGQKFDERAIKKIEEIKKIVGDLGELGMDGGLNDNTIKLCQKAGANIFYIGNSFWQAEDLEKRYNDLLELLNNL